MCMPKTGEIEFNTNTGSLVLYLCFSFVLCLNWTVFNEVGKLQKRDAELDLRTFILGLLGVNLG